MLAALDTREGNHPQQAAPAQPASLSRQPPGAGTTARLSSSRDNPEPPLGQPWPGRSSPKQLEGSWGSEHRAVAQGEVSKEGSPAPAPPLLLRMAQHLLHRRTWWPGDSGTVFSASVRSQLWLLTKSRCTAVMESQNIQSWKGSTEIMESSSLHPHRRV